MLGATRINATLTEIRYKYNVNSLEQLPTRSLGFERYRPGVTER